MIIHSLTSLSPTALDLGWPKIISDTPVVPEGDEQRWTMMMRESLENRIFNFGALIQGQPERSLLIAVCKLMLDLPLSMQFQAYYSDRHIAAQFHLAMRFLADSVPASLKRDRPDDDEDQHTASEAPAAAVNNDHIESQALIKARLAKASAMRSSKLKEAASGANSANKKPDRSQSPPRQRNESLWVHGLDDPWKFRTRFVPLSKLGAANLAKQLEGTDPAHYEDVLSAQELRALRDYQHQQERDAVELGITLPLQDSKGGFYTEADFNGDHLILFEQLSRLSCIPDGSPEGAAEKAGRTIAAALDIVSQVDEYRRTGTCEFPIKQLGEATLCVDFQFGHCSGLSTGICPKGHLHRCADCEGDHQASANLETGGFVPLSENGIFPSHSPHCQAGCHHHFIATAAGTPTPRVFAGQFNVATLVSRSAPRCFTEAGVGIMSSIQESRRIQAALRTANATLGVPNTEVHVPLPAITDEVVQQGKSQLRVCHLLAVAEQQQPSDPVTIKANAEAGSPASKASRASPRPQERRARSPAEDRAARLKASFKRKANPADEAPTTHPSVFKDPKWIASHIGASRPTARFDPAPSSIKAESTAAPKAPASASRPATTKLAGRAAKSSIAARLASKLQQPAVSTTAAQQHYDQNSQHWNVGAAQDQEFVPEPEPEPAGPSMELLLERQTAAQAAAGTAAYKAVCRMVSLAGALGSPKDPAHMSQVLKASHVEAEARRNELSKLQPTDFTDLWRVLADAGGMLSLEHLQGTVLFLDRHLNTNWETGPEIIQSLLYGEFPEIDLSNPPFIAKMLDDIENADLSYQALQTAERNVGAHTRFQNNSPWKCDAPLLYAHPDTITPTPSQTYCFRGPDGPLGRISPMNEQPFHFNIVPPFVVPVLDMTPNVTMHSAEQGFYFLKASYMALHPEAKAIAKAKTRAEVRRKAEPVGVRESPSSAPRHWMAVRSELMALVLYAKFKACKNSRILLLTICATKKPIAFAMASDILWGIGLAPSQLGLAIHNEDAGFDDQGVHHLRSGGYNWKGRNTMSQLLHFVAHHLASEHPQDAAAALGSPLRFSPLDSCKWIASNSQKVKAEAAVIKKRAGGNDPRIMSVANAKRTAEGKAELQIRISNDLSARAVQLGISNAAEAVQRELEPIINEISKHATLDLPPGSAAGAPPAPKQGPLQHRQAEVKLAQINANSAAQVLATTMIAAKAAKLAALKDSIAKSEATAYQDMLATKLSALRDTAIQSEAKAREQPGAPTTLTANAALSALEKSTDEVLARTAVLRKINDEHDAALVNSVPKGTIGGNGGSYTDDSADDDGPESYGPVSAKVGKTRILPKPIPKVSPECQLCKNKQFCATHHPTVADRLDSQSSQPTTSRYRGKGFLTLVPAYATLGLPVFVPREGQSSYFGHATITGFIVDGKVSGDILLGHQREQQRAANGLPVCKVKFDNIPEGLAVMDTWVCVMSRVLVHTLDLPETDFGKKILKDNTVNNMCTSVLQDTVISAGMTSTIARDRWAFPAVSLNAIASGVVTAFHLFARECGSTANAAAKALSSSDEPPTKTEVGRQLGNLWRALTKDEKCAYDDRATLATAANMAQRASDLAERESRDRAKAREARAPQNVAVSPTLSEGQPAPDGSAAPLTPAPSPVPHDVASPVHCSQPKASPDKARPTWDRSGPTDNPLCAEGCGTHWHISNGGPPRHPPGSDLEWVCQTCADKRNKEDLQFWNGGSGTQPSLVGLEPDPESDLEFSDDEVVARHAVTHHVSADSAKYTNKSGADKLDQCTEIPNDHGPDWDNVNHFGMCGQSCGCCRDAHREWLGFCQVCRKLRKQAAAAAARSNPPTDSDSEPDQDSPRDPSPRAGLPPASPSGKADSAGAPSGEQPSKEQAHGGDTPSSHSAEPFEAADLDLLPPHDGVDKPVQDPAQSTAQQIPHVNPYQPGGKQSAAGTVSGPHNLPARAAELWGAECRRELENDPDGTFINALRTMDAICSPGAAEAEAEAIAHTNHLFDTGVFTGNPNHDFALDRTRGVLPLGYLQRANQRHVCICATPQDCSCKFQHEPSPSPQSKADAGIDAAVSIVLQAVGIDPTDARLADKGPSKATVADELAEMPTCKVNSGSQLADFSTTELQVGTHCLYTSAKRGHFRHCIVYDTIEPDRTCELSSAEQETASHYVVVRFVKCRVIRWAHRSQLTPYVKELSDKQHGVSQAEILHRNGNCLLRKMGSICPYCAKTMLLPERLCPTAAQVQQGTDAGLTETQFTATSPSAAQQDSPSDPGTATAAVLASINDTAAVTASEAPESAPQSAAEIAGASRKLAQSRLAAALNAPSTTGRGKKRPQQPTLSASKPWFGTGKPVPDLPRSGKGAQCGPAIPVNPDSSDSDSPGPISRKLVARKRATTTSDTRARQQSQSPSKPKPLSKSEAASLAKCDKLYKAENGLYMACILHTEQLAAFENTMLAHEVFISFPSYYEQRYPVMFEDTKGKQASLYRSALNCICARDGREGTPHNQNSPTKQVSTKLHAQRRNKRALLREKPSLSPLHKEAGEHLDSPKINKSFELMAVSASGIWKACTAKVSAKRLKALGKTLPEGHMWIRWQNHYVTAMPIDRVADLQRDLVGTAHNPLGESAQLTILMHARGEGVVSAKTLTRYARNAATGPASLAEAEGVQEDGQQPQDKTKKRSSSVAELDTEQIFKKHLKLKSDNYEREWNHFQQFLAYQSKIATPVGGWCKSGYPHSFPAFNIEVLQDYSTWLLINFKKGTLVHSQAAINYFYTQAKLPAPWLGRQYSRTMARYIDARLEIMIENQEFKSGQIPAGCRIPVHEDIFIALLNKAEKMQTSNEDRSKIAIMLIGWLFLLRASSLFFEPGDIRFIKDGDGRNTTLILESSVVKMKGVATKHQKRCQAPDPKLGPRHPRARIFKLIQECLDYGNLFCIPTPEDASTTVSGWMDKIISPQMASLVRGQKISSHSLRKAGASALCSLGADLRTMVMPWGEWKTMTSAEKYAAQGYIVSKFSGGVFDWMLPTGSPFTWDINVSDV